MAMLSYRLGLRGAWVVLLQTIVALPAAPGDWPQWQGPARDGVSSETGLLKEWPAAGPKLVWKATGLGQAYGSVILQGDRIYVAGDKEGASFLNALKRADGKPVWTAKLGKGGAPGWGGFVGPRSTPATDGELVVAATQWGELACFESASGKELWRKDYTRDFGGSRPEWGFAESPLIDADRVVVTPGGSKGAVVALNKKTGAVLWQSEQFTDRAHYSSVIVEEIGGIRQYIQLTAGSVAGIAAADGKLLWRATRKGETAVIPTPVYSDSMVYVTSGYGIGCNLFRITETGGKFNVEQVYANKVMGNHHGGVVKVGNFIYGYSDSKGWTCQDFKTGEARWQEKEKLKKGSVVFADGNLYLREEDKPGTVALVEATPEGYLEHGRFNPPDRSPEQSWSHPVVAGGRLYLRDMDVLLCYDVKAP